MNDATRKKLSERALGAVPPHGDPQSYKGGPRRKPCRCPKCTRGWRDYKRALKKRKEARVA